MITITSSIKGGTYNKEQTLKLTASDKKGNKSAINIQKYVIDASIIDPPVEELTKVTLEASSKNVNVGDKIKLTATVNTEDPTVEYSFGYYDDNNKWHQLRDYTSSPSYIWTTTDAGTFEIVAKAKSEEVSIKR